MRRLTYVQDGSNKFWEGTVEGSVLRVKFGRFGTEGQTKDKDMGSAEAAQKELAKLIREKLGKGYVEESAGTDKADKLGAKAPAPAKAGTKTTKDAGKYPFLFYGARPTDWAEGANAGHVYDVRFQKAPDAKTRIAIAETFEKACYKSNVDPDASPWQWAGNWVLVSAGEGDEGGEDFFKDMQKALKAVHEVAPICEVIYWMVQEDDLFLDKWTKWTLSQQKKPTPEPKYPGQEPVEYFEQSVDHSIAKPAEDEVFEERREEVRVRQETGTGPLPGQIGLMPLDKKKAPRPAPLQAKIRALFDKHCTIYAKNGSVVAVNATEKKLFYVDASGGRQVAKAKGTPNNPVFTDDGKLVIFGAEGEYQERKTRIYQMSLPDGKCEEIWNFPVLDQYATAVPVGEDRLAILVSNNLLLVGREDGAEYDQKSVDGYSLNGVHNGDLIFLQSSAASKPVTVFRTDGGNLKSLGRIGPNFWQTWEIDGRYYGGQTQEGGKVFEILNVNEVLAKPKKSK